MDFKRKVFLVGCFLIIDVLLLCGIVLLRDITFQNILKTEVNALIELDLLKDRYNSNIKSDGKYADIEKSIKEYLDNYASLSQEVFDSFHLCDNLISIDNYVTDGTDFTESFKFIETNRDEFNKNVDLLMEQAETDEVNNYIYTSLQDNETIALYHDLLLDEKLFAELDDAKLLIEKRRIEVNSYFNSVNNVLVFLNYNKDHYKVENNELIFDNDQLKLQYNELIAKTKRI